MHTGHVSYIVNQLLHVLVFQLLVPCQSVHNLFQVSTRDHVILIKICNKKNVRKSQTQGLNLYHLGKYYHVKGQGQIMSELMLLTPVWNTYMFSLITKKLEQQRLNTFQNIYKNFKVEATLIFNLLTPKQVHQLLST